VFALQARASAKAKGKKTDEARANALRAMILDILGEADYDLAKSFDPELSEDFESSERTMGRMVDIADRHLTAMGK
jgi:hypothetical protein